jgi:hypothetical protein
MNHYYILTAVVLVALMLMVNTTKHDLTEQFYNSVEKFEVSGSLENQVSQIVDNLKNVNTIANDLVSTNKFVFNGRLNPEVLQVSNVAGTKFEIGNGSNTLEFQRYDQNDALTTTPFVITDGSAQVNGVLTAVNGTTVNNNVLATTLNIKGNATFENEFYIDGVNKWRFHTPNEKKSLIIAPRDNAGKDIEHTLIEPFLNFARQSVRATTPTTTAATTAAPTTATTPTTTASNAFRPSTMLGQAMAQLQTAATQTAQQTVERLNEKVPIFEYSNTGELRMLGRKPVLTRVFTLRTHEHYNTNVSTIRYPAMSFGGLAAWFDVEENASGNFSFIKSYKKNGTWFIFHNYAAQNVEGQGGPLKVRCNFFHRSMVDDEAGEANLDV